MKRVRATRIVVVGVVLAVLSGCAAIPTSGPVERVDDESGLGESTVRYTPTGPAPGASRVQILSGFLDAMLAYPVSHQLAAQYLTPEAAAAWRPGSGTTVYDAATTSDDDDGTGVDLQVSARLDDQGRFRPVRAAHRVELDLRRVDGQWRIATPPDGVLVSADWYDDYVRPFNLYFLDASGQHLVPDPVHEVVGDQLATSLMTSLAAGPTGGEPPGLTTAVPPSDELRSSVPIVDAVAQVDFSTRVADLSTEDQRRLSAQIAWTLRQVPSVTDLRITGDGSVVAPTGDAIQDVSGWASFGPDKSRRWVYATTEAGVRQVGPTSSSPVPGFDAEPAADVSMVTSGADLVVAVGTAVARIGVVGSDEALEVSGSRFARPVIDIDGFAWLLDRPGGGVRLRVSDGTGLDTVDVGAASDFSAFSVSPDGARYVAVVDEVLVVGGIDRREGRPVRLTEPTPIPTAEQRAVRGRSPVWIDGVRIAYLGSPGSQVQSIRIDGTDPVDGWPGGGQLLPDVTPVSLVSTSAAASDLYLLDVDGRLWFLGPTRWIEIDIAAVRGIA